MGQNSSLMLISRAQSKQDFCYLTTIGRRSGQLRTVEIWFGVYQHSLYILSGGGDASNWVRNLQVNPRVCVRIGRTTFRGRGRVVSDATEDHMARRLLAAKYQDWAQGKRLSSWARTALPIAVDLSE